MAAKALAIAKKEEQEPKLVSQEPGVEEIRHRAYELYLHRGCESGMELDDWLQAEAELLPKPTPELI